MKPAITKPKLFLDSTALISAVITRNASAPIRRIVHLGEANVVDIRISREVIGDTERFIRDRNDQMLPLMAEAIIKGRMATTPAPSKETIDFCETLTGYRPDARILAAAVEANADILVTSDKTHLLGNPKIAPPEMKILVMNPNYALAWCYERWIDARLP